MFSIMDAGLISQSGWRESLGVESGDKGFVAGHWTKIPWDLAVIYVLHGRSHIVESVATEASLSVVAAAEVVLSVALGKRRIYWAAVPNLVDGGQLKVCGCDSDPVIGLYCSDGQNGN
uniref:Uncharacterized protein n=1 Tax=Romanomermis culicivorax TaxID=13658 RepID=A0A915KAW7_ROMCU